MAAIVMLVIMLIMDIVRPVPKAPARPGLGDFDTPTAEQDRPVPVFWGKPWLNGPNLVWYGDLSTKKITQTVKGTFIDKKQTIGYEYSLGLHLVFGYGDENTFLREIWVGGTNSVSGGDQVWKGRLGSGNGKISDWNIWGGKEGGGGIGGTFTFMPGGRAQGQNAYLRKQLGSRVPAWRGVCGISWNGGYHGNTKSVQNWAAQIERLPRGLGSGFHSVEEEANGAEIQFELLTNPEFGMGLTAGEINLPALRECARIIHSEGLGMSLVWDQAKSLEDMLKEVDRHMGSLTFIEPTTGLWSMKMIRGDYDTESLPRVNAKNAKLLKFQRPTADELVNEIIVTYASDEYQGKTLPHRAQDTAAYQNRDNQRVSSSLGYPGFTKLKNAQTVCSRDLREMSYPFARVQLELDRSFHKIKPVDRLMFDWVFPDGAIENMPLIVLDRDIGTLTDGKITVTCAQDVFGVGTAIYTEGGNSGWSPPDRQPRAPTAYRMEFTPYWLLKKSEDVPGPLAAVPMVLVEAPTPSSLSFITQFTDPSMGGVFAEDPDSQPFTPTATLVYDYLETVGQDNGGTLIVGDLKGLLEIVNQPVADLRFLGSGLVIIDNEILGFTSAVSREDGTWAITGVKRGLLDTATERHLAGSKVWFISEDMGRTPTQLLPFAAGSYRARIMTQALGGTLDIGLAPTLTITTNAGNQNARPLYPYPPRNLRVNGSPIPGVVPANLISVTWDHANKTTEETIRFQDEPSAKPGDTYYIAYLYDDTGSLKAQSGQLVGGSYSFAVGDVVGGLPTAGYVQVVTYNAVGPSNRATLWFGRAVDYAGTQDAGPQRFLDEAGPWSFTRMAD